MALLFPPAMTAIMNSVPDEKQGQASGIVLTAQIIGATIGLSVLSAILREVHTFRIVFITTAVFISFALVIAWLYLERKHGARI